MSLVNAILSIVTALTGVGVFWTGRQVQKAAAANAERSNDIDAEANKIDANDSAREDFDSLRAEMREQRAEMRAERDEMRADRDRARADRLEVLNRVDELERAGQHTRRQLRLSITYNRQLAQLMRDAGLPVPDPPEGLEISHGQH